jgi:hypothetical protein
MLKQHDRRLILACSVHDVALRRSVAEIERRIEAMTVASSADLELRVPTGPA